jgi:hypothetical protein
MGILGFFRRRKKNRVALEGGPGDSVENAVIIHCTDYLAGSRAQHKYLEKMCGRFITDWTLDVKMLIKKDGRNYDLIGIKMEDGAKRNFYFDSTEMLKCLNLELFGIKEN